MRFLTKAHVALMMVLCATIGVLATAYPGRTSSSVESAESQDVRSLDRRISSLEQRLYSIESNINRLENSTLSQRTQLVQPDVQGQEFNLLRTEIQTLQARLSEIECGLVNLMKGPRRQRFAKLAGVNQQRLPIPAGLHLRRLCAFRAGREML